MRDSEKDERSGARQVRHHTHIQAPRNVYGPLGLTTPTALTGQPPAGLGIGEVALLRPALLTSPAAAAGQAVAVFIQRRRRQILQVRVHFEVLSPRPQRVRFFLWSLHRRVLQEMDAGWSTWAPSLWFVAARLGRLLGCRASTREAAAALSWSSPCCTSVVCVCGVGLCVWGGGRGERVWPLLVSLRGLLARATTLKPRSCVSPAKDGHPTESPLPRARPLPSPWAHTRVGRARQARATWGGRRGERVVVHSTSQKKKKRIFSWGWAGVLRLDFFADSYGAGGGACGE